MKCTQFLHHISCCTVANATSCSYWLMALTKMHLQHHHQEGKGMNAASQSLSIAKWDVEKCSSFQKFSNIFQSCHSNFEYILWWKTV